MTPTLGAPRRGPAGRGGAPARVVGRWWAALALAAGLATAVPAQGQEAPVCAAADVVSGRVLSSGDGSPVVGASVVFPGAQLRLLTDPRGRFQARGLCPGPQPVSVSHLAFGTTTLTAEVRPGQALEIRLAPRAIPLEGLVVEVEPVLRRLERRRHATGVKSRAFDFSGLAQEELPHSIPEHVAAHTGHPLHPCADHAFGDVGCYPFRGGRKRVEVCLDSAPLPGGAPMLELLPQADVARVEFYPALGIMKVFTRDFLVLAAEKPWLIGGMVDSC